MSADALHPQLLKTVSSICEKIEMEEFSVFKYDYWTDEERFVIFTIELNVSISRRNGRMLYIL